MLAGLLYPTSGRVEVAGFVPWGGGPEFKRRIALVLGNRQQLVWDLPPEETFLLNRAIYEIAPAAYRERLRERGTPPRPRRARGAGGARTALTRGLELWRGGHDGVPAEPLGALGEGKSFRSPTAVLEVPREEAAATSARLLAALPVAALSIEDPPIEDVIRQAFTRGVQEDDS